MKSFYLTDKGRVRDHNEDSVTIIKNDNNELLAIVADGMGGHKAGEVASTITVNMMSENFKQDFKSLSKLKAVNWIRDNVNKINAELTSYMKNHSEAKGMGTTLVMAIVTKEYILVANIGDSSAWAYKNNKLSKITSDHTLVNLLIKAGEITKEEAMNHPKKNILMKALGTNNPIEADIFDCDLDIDGLLLCSDGLTNMLDSDQIAQVLDEKITIQDKVTKLINKANNRGGLDNISVAYIDFKGGK